MPTFFRPVGLSTPTTPRLLHRRHFRLRVCDLRAFLLSSLRVPCFLRRRCINFSHDCCGKRFRFVGMYHHQSMLLAGLHGHHRPVGAIGRLVLSPSTSSRINRRHVGTPVSVRTLKPARRVTAVVGYPSGGQGSKLIMSC